MDVVEFNEPRNHVIIKDFLTQDEQNLLWDEIKENKLKFKSGKYKKDGVDIVHENIKKNLGFDVSSKYQNIDDSNILCMFHYKIFQNKSLIQILNSAKSPIYQILKFTKYDRTKVSAYGNGDFYDWHRDGNEDGILTVLYMLCKEPQKFSGGDLMLKWNENERTIPFKNNTLLIFPRNTLHTVTDIKMDSKKFWDKRFTIQCFANLK